MRLYRPATPQELGLQHAAQAQCEDAPYRPIHDYSDIILSADDPRLFGTSTIEAPAYQAEQKARNQHARDVVTALVTPVVTKPKRDRAEYMRGYRARQHLRNK